MPSGRGRRCKAAANPQNTLPASGRTRCWNGAQTHRTSLPRLATFWTRPASPDSFYASMVASTLRGRRQTFWVWNRRAQMQLLHRTWTPSQSCYENPDFSEVYSALTKFVFIFKMLRVCLIFRQTDEAPAKQEKFQTAQKFPAGLSTGSVDRFSLVARGVILQRTRESLLHR